MPPKPAQDPNLDILRAVAVLAVFVTHLLQVVAGCKFGERLAFGIDTYALGHAGVLLFFVHTSLVLMQSLERTGGGCGQFYVRRAFRIYPLSVTLVVLSILLRIPPNALNVPPLIGGWTWIASNLLLIGNITGYSPVSGPLWSLPYEVQMYLVLPLLFLALRAPGSAARLALIYVNGALLSLYHPVFRYIPCFLAGVVAYKLLGRVRPRVAAWLWLPAATGAVVMYTAAPFSDISWSKNVSLCLLAGVLVPLFHRSYGPLSAAASQIAKYSYGIYLCHTPVLWLVYRKLGVPGWQRVFWVVAGTGALSVLCYRTIEHPLIVMGSNIAKKFRRPFVQLEPVVMDTLAP